MTISEFDAWLDGFEAAFDGAPSAEQWLVIRAKFSEVVRDEEVVWDEGWPQRHPFYTAPDNSLPPVISQPWMSTWRTTTG